MAAALRRLDESLRENKLEKPLGHDPVDEEVAWHPIWTTCVSPRRELKYLNVYGK